MKGITGGFKIMKENVWKTYTDEQVKELEALSGRYKAFLNAGKTERECGSGGRSVWREQPGIRAWRKCSRPEKQLEAGDKVYACGMKKMLVLFQIGRKPLEDGMRILGAHIDSPRLDLKQNPLYEDTEMAYLDTHYYGGVKNYQWVTIPLAIHGVVAKKDGSVVEICIGEKEDDPVVFISDFTDPSGCTADGQEGKGCDRRKKNLHILIGSRPLAKTEGEEEEKADKEAVKANILGILKEKYGIEEDDFLSAELEIVPADKARDCGLDRSMIMAYGQDDRGCVLTPLWRHSLRFRYRSVRPAVCL